MTDAEVIANVVAGPADKIFSLPPAQVYQGQAVLALLPDAPAEPPRRGMEEQQRFEQALHAVPQPVHARDVCQFVGEQHFYGMGQGGAFDRLGLCHIPVGTGNTERLMAAVAKARLLSLMPWNRRRGAVAS